MSNPAGSDPNISQNFGTSSVSSGSRLFQGMVQGDVHLHREHFRLSYTSNWAAFTPKPTILIGFGRDTDFIQRGDTMAHVHELCARQYSRIALVGLGGVGKSQVAIEYAYQIRERSPETWVFWVYASSAVRFEIDFRNIANYAKLPGRENPDTDVLQLVSNWLVSEKSGKWVIVLDNLDSADFLFEGQTGPNQNRPHLVSYLPSCEKGSILITSRNRDAALKLVELPSIVQLDPMTPMEAVALAEKKLATSDENMGRLAATLEYMPLAIVQAAAYIARMGQRCSVDQYLERFEQSDHDKAKLLNFNGGQLRRDPEAKNSIIITWQLMFDHIHHTRPSAAHLLSFMSVCNSQIIPKYILEPPVYNPYDPLVAHPCPLRDVCKSWHHDFSGRCDEDILHLEDCSLVSASADGLTYRMHSLVQLATRKWLQASGNDGQNLWQHALMKGFTALLTLFSSDKCYFYTWAQCVTHLEQGQMLLPQWKGFMMTSDVHSLTPPCPQDKPSLAVWAELQYRLAFFWVAKLHWLPDALYRAEWALKYALECIGRGSDLALMAADLICIIRMTMHLTETFTTAINLYSQENKEARRRTDTPDKTGAWDAMVEKRTERIKDAQQALGHQHPHTLTLVNELALPHMSQGHEEEAKRLLRSILENITWGLRCFWDPRLIALNLHSLIDSDAETNHLARELARQYREVLNLQTTFNDPVRIHSTSLFSQCDALLEADIAD
ncbi:hypothetical protein PG991_000721 [Apiospora marii]|uniref:NB-ARC domain-containing protein n=1 Tax=Apiospora marii TaxID=335849 RepID=A0ABR1SSR6_9PEZI